MQMLEEVCLRRRWRVFAAASCVEILLLLLVIWMDWPACLHLHDHAWHVQKMVLLLLSMLQQQQRVVMLMLMLMLLLKVLVVHSSWARHLVPH